MNFSEQELKLIEEYAAALLTVAETAVLLSLSGEETREFKEMIKNHPDSAVFTAYNRGRLHTKFELRRKVIDLAKRGSPAAQPIAEKYLHENA